MCIYFTDVWLRFVSQILHIKLNWTELREMTQTGSQTFLHFAL